MALVPAQAEELDATQQYLRSEFRPPQAAVRNVAIAAETTADSYFDFRGVTYKVPAISYAIGVQLQEIHLEIERLSELEQQHGTTTLTKEQAIEQMEKLMICYERAARFFHAAAFPLSFWRRWSYKRHNPFVTCTAKEVGELLAFFSMCRMKSRVSIKGSSATRPSVSL